MAPAKNSAVNSALVSSDYFYRCRALKNFVKAGDTIHLCHSYTPSLRAQDLLSEAFESALELEKVVNEKSCEAAITFFDEVTKLIEAKKITSTSANKFYDRE